MKVSLCVLSILFPVLSWAELAGDWVGTINTPTGERRIVLHISGTDTELKATSDSPDQHNYNVPIDLISFSDSTLHYKIPPYEIEYSGVLNSDGRIAGTMTQHGGSVSLVFARSDDAGRVMPPGSNLDGSVTNGRYHHNATGVEFDLPEGWSFQRCAFNAGNDGAIAILKDSSGKALFVQLWMLKANTKPENMPRALDGAVADEVMVHKDEGPGSAKRALPDYTIPENSVQQTTIAGHPAWREEFAELLGWVFSENTRTHFVVRTTAQDVPALRAPFEAMLESAKIP